MPVCRRLKGYAKVEEPMSQNLQGGPPDIATSSIGEGLDFACNLLVGPLTQVANSHPAVAPQFLQTLSLFISLHYAGEEGLAFEYLISLARDLECRIEPCTRQFWLQIEWLSQQLDVPFKPLSL
jgi:hypothetical protein